VPWLSLVVMSISLYLQTSLRIGRSLKIFCFFVIVAPKVGVGGCSSSAAHQ